MSYRPLLILLLTLALAAGCGRSKQSEQQRLLGTWKVAHLEVSAKVIPEALRRGFDVTITTAHVNLNLGTEQLKAVYVLHPHMTPSGIDLTRIGSLSGRMTQGVYIFEGERLKLCLADPGRARPTEFHTSANTGGILVILERDK